VSLERLLEHQRVWANKPVLARVYRPWFDELLRLVPAKARALELGAGPGLLAASARARRPDIRLVTADILATPWNDLAADAGRLPLRSGAMDVVLGLDVVHHLARPADFFAEAARVLAPGGRLAVVEPWVTPFSYPIYRWLHHEGCRLHLDPWNPFGTRKGRKDAFEGDAAVPWALVRRTPREQWAALGLEPPSVRLLNGFAHLLSLGFKRGSLLPVSLAPALHWLDSALEPASPLVAMRALAVWAKPA
jgi:SAM-dependent methyltransferase